MRRRSFLVPCCVLLSAGSLLGQAGAASPDRLTGTWKGEAGPNGGSPNAITMELKFDGKSAVSGAILGFPSPGDVKTGTFDPQTGALKLELGETGKPAVMLVFEGTVVKGTATGRVSGDGKAGTFIIAKAGSALPAAPQAGGGDPAAALRKSFGDVSAWVTKAAELAPANKYSYKPAPTVRTYGQLIGHIADSYNYYCSIAAGKNVQWSDPIEKGTTDKATLAPKLKQATDACNAAYNGTGQVGPLVDNVGHTNLHYGNLITYIRMLGLTPPSS